MRSCGRGGDTGWAHTAIPTPSPVPAAGDGQADAHLPHRRRLLQLGRHLEPLRRQHQPLGLPPGRCVLRLCFVCRRAANERSRLEPLLLASQLMSPPQLPLVAFLAQARSTSRTRVPWRRPPPSMVRGELDSWQRDGRHEAWRAQVICPCRGGHAVACMMASLCVFPIHLQPQDIQTPCNSSAPLLPCHRQARRTPAWPAWMRTPPPASPSGCGELQELL